ncbi:MAG: DUF2617 family protein [Campylobacterota bacterium]|nr:DUF2617 family protein [Campylobacterota bacterium]
MNFIDQSIKDLKLNITQESFNRKILTEVALDNIVITNKDIDIRVEASIIGASHSITIFDNKTGDELFTEVLANIDLSKEVDDLDVEVFYDLPYVKRVSKKLLNNITYEFSAFVIDLEYKSDTVILHNLINTIDMAKKDEKNLGLKFTFPSKEEVSIWKPMTLVYIESLNDSTIDIHTAHIYSSEKRALYSHSVITFEKNTIPKEKEYFRTISLNKFMTQLEKSNEFSDEQLKIIQNALNEAEYKINLDFIEELEDAKSFISDGFSKIKENVRDFETKINSEDTQDALNEINDGFKNFFDSLGKKL